MGRKRPDMYTHITYPSNWTGDDVRKVIEALEGDVEPADVVSMIGKLQAEKEKESAALRSALAKNEAAYKSELADLARLHESELDAARSPGADAHRRMVRRIMQTTLGMGFVFCVTALFMGLFRQNGFMLTFGIIVGALVVGVAKHESAQ